MTEFLNMGGYAFYIWGAFSISTVIIAINIIEPLLQHKTALQQADDFYREENPNDNE